MKRVFWFATACSLVPFSVALTQERIGAFRDRSAAFSGGQFKRAQLSVQMAGAVRWEPSEGGNGHFYKVVLVGSPLSWDDARAAAQALGPTWDLATITSAAENDFVEDLFASDPSFFNMDHVPGARNRSGPWIGGFDVLGSTNFKWVTGEPVTFTDWGPAEPFGNGQTIAYADFSSPFGDGSGVAWNDIGPNLRSDGPIAYVVESPTATVPWERCQGGNGHFYKVVLVGSPLSWDDARAAAQALGPTWDLATITSAAENDFVEDLFASDPSFFNMDHVPGAGNRSGPWIGGFDVLGSTTFKWVTGEPVTFTDWGPAEPFGNGQTIAYADFSSPFGDGSGVAWNDIGPNLRSDGPIAYVAESPEILIFESDFESGNLDGWSGASGTFAGLLEVGAGSGSNATFGLVATVGATCSETVDLVVAGPTASGDYLGCSSVTANAVEVVPPGATFAAGNLVTLGEGFSVASDAGFTAAIDTAFVDGFAFVEDGSPEAETVYSAEFKLSLDGATLDPANDIEHFVGYSAAGLEEFRGTLIRNATLPENRLILAARLDSGAYAQTPSGEQILLPAGWRALRFAWRAGSGNGSFLVSLDGAPCVGLVDLDNDTRTIDFVRWGAVDGNAAASSGTLAMDDFRSWR